LLRQLPPAPTALGAELTPRELEILTLSASGKVNKQVAQVLGIRLNTVRNHMQKILSKLESHSKLEAVATAVREGILVYASADQPAVPSEGRTRERTIE
jgi:DNA-binding NarL/FixJ family response regulator